MAQGARAVLCEAPVDDAMLAQAGQVPLLQVTGLRGLLGGLGDTWYDRPSAELAVVAVTGTNGKTSSVQWIAHALSRNDKACGTIGTLGAVLPDGQTLGGSLTTPDVLTVHRLLAAMRDAGAKAVAMEASSIGIEQGRMDGVRVALAAFTNLTRDHLDYHGTMERYEAAKARLFHWPELGGAVINADDEAGRRLLAALPQALAATGYSLSDDATVPATMRARDLQATAQGQIFTLVSPHGEAQIVTRLLGAHNVSTFCWLPACSIAWACRSRRSRANWPPPIRSMAGCRPWNPLPFRPRALAARWWWWTMPTRLTRWRARSPRCGQWRTPARAGWSACSAAAAIAIRASVPSWAASRRNWLTAWWCPATIRATKCPRTSSGRSWPACPLRRTPWSRSTAPAPSCRPSGPARRKTMLLLAGKGHETYQDSGGEKLPFDDREWARLALLLPQVATVSTDTRRIGAGELFVALAGEKFDAHDYLDQAEARGACAAVVAHPSRA